MTTKENADYMAKLVTKFKSSRQTQKEFSAAHGLNEGKLCYWISKLRKQQAPIATSSTPQKDFVAIEVTAADSPANIIIRLQSGVEIEIPV